MGDNESGTFQDISILIREKAQCLEDNDYYKLLEIPQQSSSNEVRDAYFRLAKQLHPDAVAKAGIENEKEQALK